ncbi:hypothetical protein [Gemmatimonas aurantiaca]|uniref:hypothetical protein n=1 Tax=Gemmatimonas aurantiaca TaxID=173480 RepID=UPI00301BA48D
MDVLVRLEARPSDSPVLAHVNSIPVLPFGTRSRREVVTLYGEADAQSLALALAATVESERLEAVSAGVVRHLGVWPDRGAVGDSAWRDGATGRLVTQDLDIPFLTLEARAVELLGACGPTLRRVAAGLAMPDWPEGTERALSFSLMSATAASGGAGNVFDDDTKVENWLDSIREADAFTYDVEGD